MSWYPYRKQYMGLEGFGSWSHCSKSSESFSHSPTRNLPVLAEFKEVRNTLAYEKMAQGGCKSLVIPKSNSRQSLVVITPNIAAQLIRSNIVGLFIGVAMNGAGIMEFRTQIIINCVSAFGISLVRLVDQKVPIKWESNSGVKVLN